MANAMIPLKDLSDYHYIKSDCRDFDFVRNTHRQHTLPIQMLLQGNKQPT